MAHVKRQDLASPLLRGAASITLIMRPEADVSKPIHSTRPPATFDLSLRSHSLFIFWGVVYPPGYLTIFGAGMNKALGFPGLAADCHAIVALAIPSH